MDSISLLMIIPSTILFLIVFLTFRRTGKHKVSKARPPGNMAMPFIGETFAFLKPQPITATGEFMDQHMCRFGKIFSSHLFGNQSVVSADPEFNRFVLRNEVKSFGHGLPPAITKVLGPNSISLMAGDAHKHMRSTVLDFLSAERLRTVFLQDAHHLASQLIGSWKEGLVISAKDDATKVINETLRLGNIVRFTLRKATANVEFSDYVIPQGSSVLLHFAAVHLDPSRFEDPENFNPWRWLSSSGMKVPDCFMPFGRGARICPGAELARLEMAVFLHHLILKWDWKLAEPDHPVITPIIEFPKGLPIKVRALSTNSMGSQLSRTYVDE